MIGNKDQANAARIIFSLDSPPNQEPVHHNKTEIMINTAMPMNGARAIRHGKDHRNGNVVAQVQLAGAYQHLRKTGKTGQDDDQVVWILLLNPAHGYSGINPYRQPGIKFVAVIF